MYCVFPFSEDSLPVLAVTPEIAQWQTGLFLSIKRAKVGTK
jgi:hypothetical protein